MDLWLKENTDDDFASIVKVFINGKKLLVKFGVLKLFMPQLVRTMKNWSHFEVKIDGHTLFNNELDAIIVIGNLLNFRRQKDQIFVRPDNTTINAELADLFCLYKFIDMWFCAIENKIVKLYADGCREIVKDKIISKMQVVTNAIELLEKGPPNQSYETNCKKYESAQRLIIEKLGIGDDYRIDMYHKDDPSVRYQYPCKWLRIEGDKIVLPLFHDAPSKKVYSILKKMAAMMGCFKFDWFGPECVKYAELLGIDKNVIDYIAKNN